MRNVLAPSNSAKVSESERDGDWTFAGSIRGGDVEVMLGARLDSS